MAGGIRISKLSKECGVGVNSIIDTLRQKGVEGDLDQNTKLTEEQYDMLAKEFKLDREAKQQVDKVGEIAKSKPNKSIGINDQGVIIEGEPVAKAETVKGPKVIGKIDLGKSSRPASPKAKGKNEPKEEPKTEMPQITRDSEKAPETPAIETP